MESKQRQQGYPYRTLKTTMVSKNKTRWKNCGGKHQKKKKALHKNELTHSTPSKWCSPYGEMILVGQIGKKKWRKTLPDEEAKTLDDGENKHFNVPQ